MSELEYLDATGYGSFDEKDVLNPNYFGQEDVKDISGGHHYMLIAEGEPGSGCLCVGIVTRKGKRYHVSVSW